MPIGIPEWPELAAATASSVKVRIAQARSQWSGWEERSVAMSKAGIRSLKRGFGVNISPAAKIKRAAQGLGRKGSGGSRSGER